MIKTLLTKIFGSSNDRIIKSINVIVKNINALEPSFEKLSDQELAAKTDKFRARLASGTETLDGILPEAFATVREASKRIIGQRHFDVQLIGGIVLHRGMIPEMKTGEGKTLASTLPAYLNAIEGKGVHVVTVNDYLAKRDSSWMGRIHQFLGLSVGCIESSLSDAERQAAYNCDITYGTNNEFGFDYLRDNLKYDPEKMVQRAHNFAIIDEVDSILIDEARTPLIISGPAGDNSEAYAKVDQVIYSLNPKDYELDEKSKSCVLTDHGHETVEKILKDSGIIASDTSLYDLENMTIVHHVNQALRAHKLFSKDVDYIIKDNKIMIIDEFTGRIMDGRRYSEGLHQALEAKEKVEIQNENQTIASVTFQNYFRLYPKLSGMTGTAETEAAEFNDIYKLDVVIIPTNANVKRKDFEDEIYLNSHDKYNAIVAEIISSHATGQPILVGTTSIEKSELISGLLKAAKIKHHVLNARYHEQEASIIAQAGRLNAVTIATNMAGRGTDIMLGGNPDMMLKERIGNKSAKEAEINQHKSDIAADVLTNKEAVINAGGLYVLGTERHESRRIDNQLRGRSGRQGDIGKTKFYLCMEDDLMRIFGSDKIKNLLSKLGLKDGESITHPWISKSIEKAQQKVEGRNYETRKTLLKFDDVMNEQRKIIYEQRRYIMSTPNLSEFVQEQIEEVANRLIQSRIPESSMLEEWDLNGLAKDVHYNLGLNLEPQTVLSIENVSYDYLKNKIYEDALKIFEEKQKQFGQERFEDALKHILMMTLDTIWKDHLYLLDHLRTGIGLRAYAQKDPLNEYKMEAFQMFKHLMDEFSQQSVQRILHVQISHDIRPIEDLESVIIRKSISPTLVADSSSVRRMEYATNAQTRDPDDETTWGKVSRNENCPCGSDKKYKHCHGKFE